MLGVILDYAWGILILDYARGNIGLCWGILILDYARGNIGLCWGYTNIGLCLGIILDI